MRADLPAAFGRTLDVEVVGQRLATKPAEERARPETHGLSRG
jgi:hypothetical protein